MITKTVGQVTFNLKQDFDFSFIAEYGTPFVVFDRQDSGNLCFGVQNAEEKLFLKIAGAATVDGSVTPEASVERLISTIKMYEDLEHPSLTKLLAHKPINGGYLLVFEWFDGTSWGKQYGTYEQIRALPIEEKLGIYKQILAFHNHVNQKGYIAIDFYDGSILYNLDTHQTMVCDIEFYRKKPVVNTMGRMWGSSRYMAPEEFVLGAEIDERTNVFGMGATAFCLFGAELDRSVEKWQLSQALYNVAIKATNAERQNRYAGMAEYIYAWESALRQQ